MMKRIIALLLALILTVGLLPTVALAAKGGETPTTGTGDVKNGYYEATIWKEGPLNQGKLPTGVESVSKTAKPTSNPNEYEVTLEVVLKKTESQENPGSAATVLVLDHSGSMNGCAYCKSTKEGVQYYHTKGCKYDKGKKVTSEQSRMSAATEAVKDFIKTYSGRFDENGKETATKNLDLGRWVCLVWFNETGGVTGGGDWVDVSNKRGYETATNTNGWKAHDGTNLDCGLRLADYQLKKDTVAKISKNLKNVIVLSDGEPTYHLSTSWEFGDILHDITIDDTGYYVHGNGGSCDEDTYNTTKSTAATLRNSASVYTVCFGASKETIKDYDKNGNQTITVGDYLKQKIATQPKSGANEKFAYNAADADALNTVFAAISKTIVSGLSTGTVKDTLPPGITSAAFDNGSVKEWKLNEAPFTKNETPNTVDGKQVTTYTYTYTYTVTINPLTVEKTKIDGAYYAPLNGDTTLTVKSGDTDVEIPFPIPAGKVTMPSYKVTYKIDDAQYGDVDTVDFGTEVTVRENPTKAGYSFSGWSTTDATVADGKFTMPDKDVTLTGTWTKNSYKVTYKIDDVQYGDVDTVDFGTEVTVRENPTKAGYSFSGWSTTDATVADGKFTMPDKDVTLTGSWMLKDPTAVNVDLNDHIYKTFTSDTADIPNGKLTFNVTVSGISNNAASMTRRGSVEFTKQDVTTSKAFTFAGDQLSFTAAGEYTFKVVEDTTTTINGLTYNVGNGTHTFTIVVDKKANTNELEVKEVRVGTEEYTGVDLTDTLAYATITNNYIEPKKTFDLNNTIFKTFTPVAGGLPIPTGEGISYTFTARMTEQTEEGFAVGDTGRNYTLKATLTGEVIEANKVPFTVEGASEVSFAPGTYYFLVQEDSTAAVTGTVNGTIHNDSQAYLLTLTVKEDQGKLDFETDVKPATVVMSLEEPTPGLGTITFNNTYEEKEPGKYTIKFSDLIVKCLTKEGSKAFTGAEFTANVSGWKYMKEEAKPWAMLANATSFAFADLPSRTLTATFTADAVFNPDNEAYRPFTGDTLTVEEGDYLFLIEENNGGQSNITYDEAKYWLAVRVRFENDEPIVAVYRRTYTAGDSYNTVFENETKWSDPIPANITPVTFYNTIDTGKDDYYPIIIPTIINKDTGMLNKTDHFAYVIGYPDGTVHPNGQITRAEVATIFFRLLRDEVRDGAFTTSNSYSDVAYGKWYNNPISTMSALGIITGYPDGTFKPNKPITRAEFAAIAARFDETQSGKSATFSDVIGHWAAKEIGIAYYNDWIKGYPDGTFKPDQNITRAEAMTLINRVLERKPESPADLLTNMNKWTDNMDTSKWYYLDVQEATNSHGYTRKTFNYELWRQMLPDPDWSRYER